MATYPIKMLRDENQEPFVPMVSADSIYLGDGKSFEEKLATKLEADNLKQGSGIILTKEGNDTTIAVDFEAASNIIDNLDTTTPGLGVLDAHQGNVLKNMIPSIVDGLESADASKVLSANQGRILKEMSVPTGGITGQVLKKSSDDDHSLEWGDAADPNAIGGDGSIMKIIELTYTEYKTLESNGQLQEDTEYHITDVENGATTYLTTQDIEGIVYDITSNHTTETQVNSMIEYAVKDFVTRDETQDMMDSKIIYDNTLTANAASITIDGLDLEGDGGIYKIHMITRGTTTNVNSIYIQVNNFQQGYWCAYWRGWSNPGVNTSGGAAAQSQSWIIPNAPSWQFGEVISASFGYTDVMVMKAPDGIKFNATHSLICQEVDYCGTYSCNLYSTTDNLTKLIIFPSSGYLTPGTRIVISKL